MIDYAKLLIPRKVVELQLMAGDETPASLPISVRGLNAVDFTNLLGEYSEELGLIFDTIEDLEKPNEAEIQTVVIQILSKAPELIADALVLVTDYEIPRNVLTQMSITHQLQLVSGMVEITIESNGGLKKLQEVVVSVVRKVGLQNRQEV